MNRVRNGLENQVGRLVAILHIVSFFSIAIKMVNCLRMQAVNICFFLTDEATFPAEVFAYMVLLKRLASARSA